jgi:site-specific DNA-methyltransferase (adenine-specific)
MIGTPQQGNMWTEPVTVQRGDLFALGRHRLLCGDSTNSEDVTRLMGGETADACITDPPYPREYAHLYRCVASHLPSLLKDGGSFLSIVPHYLIPEVLNDVGKHLKYRWLISMWQANGSHPRMAMGIEIMWKPIVWWVNGSWPRGRGFVRDGFENAPLQKKFHEWEQSVSWAIYCLKFVPENGIIYEPFCGGGTVLVVCQSMGYTCYAMEIDPDACIATIQRWQAHTGQKAVKECS